MWSTPLHGFWTWVRFRLSTKTTRWRWTNSSASISGTTIRCPAIVAKLMKADALVILTDIDGLYTADPHKHPDAKRIPRVEHIDDSVKALAGGVGSSRGTGGMITKISAAEIATGAGIPTVIIAGETPQLLYDLFEGKEVGTIFCAQ